MQTERGVPTALLLQGLRDPRPARRWCSAAVLAYRLEDEAVPHLLPLLGDRDRQVRQRVGEALGQAIGQCLKWGQSFGDEVAEPLVVWAQDHRPDVRLRAVQLLRCAERTVSVRACIAALEDPVAAVRVAAANSLCGLDDPLATRSLVAHLTDPAAAVSAACAGALGQLADSRTERILIDLVGHRDEWVRYSVTHGLVEVVQEFGEKPAVSQAP